MKAMKWISQLRDWIMNAINRQKVRRHFECEIRECIFQVGLVRLDLSEPTIAADMDRQQEKLMEIHERMAVALGKLDSVHGGGTGGNLTVVLTGIGTVLAAIAAVIAWFMEWI